MTKTAGTIGQQPRSSCVLRAGASLLFALFAIVPAASAHNGTGKLRGTCQVTNLSGRATVTVTVENLWSEPIHNIEPDNLLGSSTGSASIFLQTSPRALRDLLPGKSADLEWRGRLYGDGLLDLSVEVFADFEDGHTEGTGIVNCNRIAVGNPGGDATPVGGDATPTRTAGAAGTPTSPPAAATNTPLRPTRTPIPDRPTRTPRIDPTNTNTPLRPTATRVPPTSTRIPPTNTRQPTATPPRPTRTPIPDRPTRTPIIIPTRVPTRTQPPPPTATRTLARPTNTPIPQRPTRTRAPDPTTRPTRTPILVPPTATRTATTGSDPPPGDGQLVGNCSLRRNIDFVTITMVVENRTGSDVRQVAASTLTLDPEGGSLFFDRTGPSPGQVPLLRAGVSATFQWTGRLSPGGTMGFSASANANLPHGGISTGRVDCGVTGSDSAGFDPSSFSGTCSLHPGDNGEIVFDVRNGSRENLQNVEAFFISKSATGSAQLLELRGPAPRSVQGLAPGTRRSFIWSGRLLGDGELTVQLEARGTRATMERLSTGHIECSAALGIAGGGSLPDLGVDEDDQRTSARIQWKNFPSDHCAVVEGCVDGTGNRKLLRFDTTTPNFGPGEVFVGDPGNNPRAIWSSCHMHFHVQDYADYRLLDMGGNIVARGHKQAFCLVDLWQVPGLGGSRDPKYVDCGFQGISAGWADIYNSGLDCQWIDITGVPSGRYILEVVVNPARMIQERDYSNNTARTEVVIP